MKKLKLKALELGVSELLTREQLKKIMGGTGSEDCVPRGASCSISSPVCCGDNSYCISNGVCS